METEPSTSEVTDAYFEPLGIKASLERAVHVFRQRWKHLLVISAIPIFLWYIAAIGIRNAISAISASHVENLSFEMDGETVSYQVESLHTTLSRLGLIAEFFLFSFLFLPADVANIRIVAALYAGRDADGIRQTIRQTLRAILPNLPSLGLVCAIWCAVLMLPLILIVLCMAPEGQTQEYGIAIYFEPWLPKLVFGLPYLIASSTFMTATCLSYSIITVKGGGAIASLKESSELFKKSWSHIGAVTVLWFLIKMAITKFVSAINWMYYLHNMSFWMVWEQPGIPLHPIRILWSTSSDLWGIGTSWISVPVVVFLAAMGSVFQAVFYFDTRIKQGDYTQDVLLSELGPDESEEPTDYKTMENEETTDYNGELVAAIRYKTKENEGTTDYNGEPVAAIRGDKTIV